MNEIERFLQDLFNEFREIEVLLKGILKEEKRIEDDVLVKKGFLIKKFLLNYSKINLSELKKILEELERIKGLEVHLQEQFIQKEVMIKQVEKEYKEITRKITCQITASRTKRSFVLF